VPSASRLPGALRHRNFRLFISGQLISLSGTWMQTVALGWLVLQLTNSAFKVGLVASLGSLPILLFTLYGGVIADRVNKRPALVLLQSLMLLEALTIATLTQWGWVTVSWVMALAVLLGTLSAFEVPIRQAFIVDMVGTDDLMNAIALNASAFNLTRILGPALAGVIIAAVGLAALEAEPAAVDEILAGGDVEIEIAGRRVPGRLSARPFYDPDGRRLRGRHLRHVQAGDASLDVPVGEAFGVQLLLR